jgi:DNA-binding MarR family transcriptional regulator
MVQAIAKNGRNVLELSLACCRVTRRIASSLDLSVEELYALFVLATRRPKSVKELTRNLEVRDSRTSKILHSLEQRGHITRTLSLADRRVEEVVLTSRGICVAGEILAAAEAMAAELPKAVDVTLEPESELEPAYR